MVFAPWPPREARIPKTARERVHHIRRDDNTAWATQRQRLGKIANRVAKQLASHTLHPEVAN